MRIIKPYIVQWNNPKLTTTADDSENISSSHIDDGHFEIDFGGNAEPVEPQANTRHWLNYKQRIDAEYRRAGLNREKSIRVVPQQPSIQGESHNAAKDYSMEKPLPSVPRK